MSRFTGPVRWRVADGTPADVVERVRPQARKLMGALMARVQTGGLDHGVQYQTLPDGTRLTARFDGTTHVLEVSASPLIVELPVLRCTGLKGDVAGPYPVNGWPLMDEAHPDVGLAPYARVQTWGVDFAGTEQTGTPLQLLFTRSSPSAFIRRYQYAPDTRTFSLMDSLPQTHTLGATIGAWTEGGDTIGGTVQSLGFTSAHRWTLTASIFNYRTGAAGTRGFRLRASDVTPTDPFFVKLRSVYRDPDTGRLAQYLLFVEALSASSIRAWLCILQLTPGLLSYVSRVPLNIVFSDDVCKNGADISAGWYLQRMPFMWAYGYRVWLMNSNGEVITADFAKGAVTSEAFSPMASYQWDFTDTGAGTSVCDTGVGIRSHRGTQDGSPASGQTWTQPYDLVAASLKHTGVDVLSTTALDLARDIDEGSQSHWSTSMAVFPSRKRALVFCLPVSVADENDPLNQYAPFQDRARYKTAHVYEVT